MGPADLNLHPAAPAVVGDFEGSTWGARWTATGSFAVAGPTASALVGQVGAQGADTFARGGDPSTGAITSPPFALARNFVQFLIGGGDHPLGAEPATSIWLASRGRNLWARAGRPWGYSARSKG